MKKEVFLTSDGSPSLRIEEIKETYHSRHGALTESTYVYINKGLDYWIKNHHKNELNIFEMGLGTGLNAYLAYVFSKENNVNINYHSIEKFPLTEAELHLLEMKSTLPHAEHADFYQLLHSCLWEKAIEQDGFLFSKSKIDFLELDISQKFDVIFYDAFGHHAQPELWQKKPLDICFQLLNPGGVWVSYCAKGIVRRTLEEVGFQVTRLEGPPGKREMLRAIKPI